MIKKQFIVKNILNSRDEEMEVESVAKHSVYQLHHVL